MNGAEVDPSNVSQLASWDGAGGGFWTENADRFDDGVARYRDSLLAAAEITRDARVLDVGCGTGQLTRDAARAASEGQARGVDLSSEMIEFARRRAHDEGLANASFQQADAQVHRFSDHEFDIAVSRHGAMFFGDPVAAFANIARSLRPQGRMVLLTWQGFDQQEWLSSFFSALSPDGPVPVPPPEEPGPFSLSGPERVHALLTQAGFAQVELEERRAPMYFGPDVEDALRFVAGQHAGLLTNLDTDRRARALDALRSTLTDHLDQQGVNYDSAAWLVRATRR